jgi:hypothetical protein
MHRSRAISSSSIFSLRSSDTPRFAYLTVSLLVSLMLTTSLAKGRRESIHSNAFDFSSGPIHPVGVALA